MEEKCVFCSGKHNVEDVSSASLDYFDKPEVIICQKHILEIHDRIARGEI